MPKKKLTWEDVLGRQDLIGGDFESIEDEITYRGPISKIEQQGDMIVFVSPWCAWLDPNTGKWQKCNVTSSSINMMYLPEDIGEGRVFLMATTPFPTRCTLFPKTDKKLDPDLVEGLPVVWERLLALYPSLVFDREAAIKVLVEKSWTKQAVALDGLPKEASLRDLFKAFRHPKSVEEFLWFYIEAVTNEKDVHTRVY